MFNDDQFNTVRPQLGAGRYLNQFRIQDTIGKWYDDVDEGEDFSFALTLLMPDFEYPTWSARTIQDFLTAVLETQGSI
jgi:hypothetical protein